MAIRSVLRLGDPGLLTRATDVTEFNTAELDQLIQDMFDTMKAEDGAGLAAPQIGIGLRVVIFGFDSNPRYPECEAVPKTVLINPNIIPQNQQKEDGWEGCLSVPGMRGMVSRFTHIRYTGFDAAGNSLEVTAEGFHARVVQHEYDHLDGIIYTQRLTDPLKFGFTEELLRSGQMQTEQCDE
jgi:peptide deformylase